MTRAIPIELEGEKTQDEGRGLAVRALPHTAQHERLLTLAADLLLENQKLSLNLARLQAQLEEAERALQSATACAGMIF